MFGYYLDLAWRRCRQNLSMVALLVLTMAIGIASCMTALTIFGALSGEPLPGISSRLYVATMDSRQQVTKDDDRYVADSLMQQRDAKALVDARKATRQAAMAYSLATITTTDGKQSEQTMGLLGYGQMLGLFGVALHHGRPWTVAEEEAGDPVIVIDTRVAEKLFGTEDAVGKSVRLGTGTFRVIGVSAVLHPRTRFLRIANDGSSGILGQDLQFFVPVDAALQAGVGPFIAGECPKGGAYISFQSTKVRDCRWLETWVELDTPAAVATWRKFLVDYADAQHQAGRFINPPQAKLFGTRAWMTLNKVVPHDVFLNVLLAGGFLLLCMVNVAGLLAARFLRRQADVAVRRALGASQRQVFAQHLVEAGLLGLGGGLLALPLTLLGLWIVRIQPVVYAAAATFNPAVFVALALLSLLTGLLVGILPAWRVCRQPPAMQIKVA